MSSYGARILLAGLALVGCQQARPEGNNAAVAATAIEQQDGNHCDVPALVLPGGRQSLKTALLQETQANFAAAIHSACAKGVLKDATFMDPHSTDQRHVYLVNAPEANVASIYMSEVDDSHVMLEYPFLTTDGKSQVPSVEELEEAIYCEAVGATPEEQESSGRCLVD